MLTDKLIPTHSCSIMILSDNSTEYNNKILETMGKKLNIEMIDTSPYNAQGKGTLEGWHRECYMIE